VGVSELVFENPAVLFLFSYIVKMHNGIRRHLHANRMRKLVTDVCHVAVVRKQDTDFSEILSVPVNEPHVVPNAHLTNVDYLTLNQRATLLSLLDEFSGCCFNKPGLCTVIQHKINTTADFIPKRTRVYRVPKVLKSEIKHR